MSKSVYEFWLSYNNGEERLRLSILPSVLDISNPSSSASHDISGLGEIRIIQEPTAMTFSFSSTFPTHESSLTEYSGFPRPWDCIKTIEKWKNTGNPIRFLITNTPINYAVSIDD